ncbi:21677_t:CDS:2 [Gigaspora margarita]|uniref:21677_t:CDS:1 n=1 Tax=Gigaspora margarita TaxID=4874 RepID=A0ABN7V7C6_GIGMA|nr:21677_t:CDS:2 [Gigaspora margarita]
MYSKQEFTPEEIEAFEDKIMKELFIQNLDQLKHYQSSFLGISYNYCEYKQAQEYSQKLEELRDCKWENFVGLLGQLIEQT